jgi:hypothetical protein
LGEERFLSFSVITKESLVTCVGVVTKAEAVELGRMLKPVD